MTEVTWNCVQYYVKIGVFGTPVFQAKGDKNWTEVSSLQLGCDFHPALCVKLKRAADALVLAADLDTNASKFVRKSNDV